MREGRPRRSRSRGRERRWPIGVAHHGGDTQRRGRLQRRPRRCRRCWGSSRDCHATGRRRGGGCGGPGLGRRRSDVSASEPAAVWGFTLDHAHTSGQRAPTRTHRSHTVARSPPCRPGPDSTPIGRVPPAWRACRLSSGSGGSAVTRRWSTPPLRTEPAGPSCRTCRRWSWAPRRRRTTDRGPRTSPCDRRASDAGHRQ